MSNQLFAFNKEGNGNSNGKEDIKFHQPSPKGNDLQNQLGKKSNFDLYKEKYNAKRIFNSKKGVANEEDNNFNFFSMKFGEKYEESYINNLKQIELNERKNSSEEQDNKNNVNYSNSLNLVDELEVNNSNNVTKEENNILNDLYSMNVSANVSLDTIDRNELISNVFHKDKKTTPINKAPKSKKPKKITQEDLEVLREELKSKIADISTYSHGIERLQNNDKHIDLNNISYNDYLHNNHEDKDIDESE